MIKLNNVTLCPISQRSPKVVMSMIEEICKDLRAAGLTVDYMPRCNKLPHISISDGSVYLFDNAPDEVPLASGECEIFIANRLARLLELKIVENRINDLYFDALYLGWRLSVENCKIGNRTLQELKVYMNDTDDGTKCYALTYDGIAEFEEDLARARLRRDVTFEIATKSHRAEIRLTTEGFTVDGEPYELTKQDISRAKEEHPALKGTFMLTAAERAYDEVAENL